MSDSNLDFETHYESSKCQCGDEHVELDWDEEKMAFVGECGCMKCHKLIPTMCTIEVIDN